MKSRLLYIACGILIGVALMKGAAPAFARTWYIKPDGTGDAATIQAGIDSAAVADTVMAAPGTYTGLGNRDIDFNGKAIVLTSELGADVTIIDCEYMGRGFYLHSGEDSLSIIEGFTIKKGTTLLISPLDPDGGGICCIGASPTIRNNKIFGNTAICYGAGIFCCSSSSKIYGNDIAGNYGVYYDPLGGGGICCVCGTYEIYDNAIHDNTGGVGAGIYIYGSRAIIRDNFISGNWCCPQCIIDGGGIYCRSGKYNIINNVISGNAGGNGGGIYISTSDTSIIKGNSIIGNEGSYACPVLKLKKYARNRTEMHRDPTMPYCVGGGICCSGTELLEITENRIEFNYAFEGGGIFCSGNPVISKNLILNNLAHDYYCHHGKGRGGGIYLRNSTATIIENTLIGNKSKDTYETDDSRGANIYIDSNSTPEIHNCIIAYGEIAPTGDGGGIYNANNASIPAISCCDVYGNALNNYAGNLPDQTGLNGNISVDPLFCDPANDNYYLFSNSPCLYGPCGRMGALGQGCSPIVASLDLNPRSCPNPFNITWLKNLDTEKEENAIAYAGGVMPAAIVGREDFDVTDVDVSTLLLEGVSPLRCDLEDVTIPVAEGDDCACTTGGPDGLVDLTLKFSQQEIAQSISPAEDGDVIVLTVTGALFDGTPFEASDCVKIMSMGHEPTTFTESDEVQLDMPVPNPFNPVTRIAYWLPRAGYARLSIYDVAGRLVARLVEGEQQYGKHIVDWDASGLASGTYFLRLEVGGESKVRRLTLIK
ncbi:MAG: T9SS type A sorting domain-containing protein [Candidatus Latescibacteria bacterium]|nr:T9SS type A sorting domain-containing protein [Candidatus Latescibacterota bacterium]NIO55206.1 T9SS type A sorting domain-containing protein [Candidatus Latescibacterota bacterium]